MKKIITQLRIFWQLIKSLQTGLLLATGLAGYMTARCPATHLGTLLGLAGSLFLAISGSTVLNMWYDRDIDAQMKRTANRPLPSGRISPRAALLLGSLLSVLGVGWALVVAPLYGLIVFAGLFFDVVIYTMWLKRRTAWSIVWGGISGGMPILAGRVLGNGEVDWVGLVLALAVLFWIPTHILTFSMRYFTDYQAASIPTFPARYGFDLNEDELYKPLRYHEVEVDTAVTDFSAFAERFGTNYKLLKFLNPWLRKPYLTPKAGKVYKIKIPEEGMRNADSREL